MYYEGQTGVRANDEPNVLTGKTAINWSTTVPASQMATKEMNIGGDCATFPAAFPQNRAFAIYDSTTQCAGYPVNRDPNTENNLRFVPTQYNTHDNTGRIVNTNLTKSIRIGDACGRSGGDNAEALYYYMNVTPFNAMLFIYYACVFDAPGHGVRQDPVFQIRVQKKNSANEWVQASPTQALLETHNDTLAYFITATPRSSSRPDGLVDGQDGWHTARDPGRHSVYYKDWTKVAINLIGLMYQDVRIEVMVTDCQMTQHYSYAYICGECREMVIKSSGCPAGLDSSVTTLSAPRGMLRYEWAASEYGKSDPVDRLDPGGADEYFTFRTLRMNDGSPAAGPEDSIITRNGRRDTVHYCDYDVKASDFRIIYRPNAEHRPIRPTDGVGGVVDSFGNNQTFRCRMMSALDPAKPFYTNLYLSVQNSKPSMIVDQELTCDGGVKIWNRSEVPGDPTLVDLNASTWKIYGNPQCTGQPLYSSSGSSMERQFDDTTSRYLLLRTETSDPSCYSEAVYKIRPLNRPRPAMNISNRVLCDADQTTITDNTSDVFYREWNILDEQGETQEQIKGERNNAAANRVLQRSFERSINPIKLRVLNGDYAYSVVGRDTVVSGDTAWCDATITDTVAVFVHPNLQVEGSTIVCQGSRTDATVRALGVEGCTYEWSLSHGTITGGIPAGDRLEVEPYADTAIYYVRVTSPQGCVAWDSISAYYVRPTLTMFPETAICPGDTVTLMGANADHYQWTAAPSDPSLAGQATADTIKVVPTRTTVYTMTGYGANDCASTPLQKTVTVVPLPSPEVSFSPDYIDTEKPTITLSDLSQGGVSTQWRFEGGETQDGSEVEHTFEGIDHDTATTVVLVSRNELGCSIEYPFQIPIKLYTAWMPTVFTPGSEDENDHFKLYTINTYDYFHISIYDRRGMLVFESNDPHFSWDGTYKDKPCMQGTYVYICSYRKPDTGSLITRQGSVTLLR